MKLTIKIPTSLKDITLRQYKKFLMIEEKVKDERFLNAKMIEILCNVKLEEVNTTSRSYAFKIKRFPGNYIKTFKHI